MKLQHDKSTDGSILPPPLEFEHHAKMKFFYLKTMA